MENYTKNVHLNNSSKDLSEILNFTEDDNNSHSSLAIFDSYDTSEKNCLTNKTEELKKLFNLTTEYTNDPSTLAVFDPDDTVEENHLINRSENLKIFFNLTAEYTNDPSTLAAFDPDDTVEENHRIDPICEYVKNKILSKPGYCMENGVVLSPFALKNSYQRGIEEISDNTQSSKNKKTIQNQTSEEKKENSRKLLQCELTKKLLEAFDIYLLYGTLYVYDPPRLLPITERKMVELLKKVLENKDYIPLNHCDFTSLFKYLHLSPDIKSMDSFPLYPGYVYFANGAFDITKQRTLKNSEPFVCMHQVQAKYLPDDCPDTPVWDKFLDDCSGNDPEIRLLIETFVGYALIPDQDAKAFFVVGTTPGSGKSILLKLLEKLVGEQAVCHVDPQHLGGRFALSPLVGASLNTVADISSKFMSDDSVSVIKRLTGDDPINIEEKYQNPHPYKNIAKLIFASNWPLHTKHFDQALNERLIVIPFLHSIDRAKQDKKLFEKIWLERDGIVTRCMAAVQGLIKNNYVFPPCHQSDIMKATWMNDIGCTVSCFVKHCCTLENRSAKTSTADLYQAYKWYCQKNNWIEDTENAFSRAIKRNFSLKPTRPNGKHGFLGIQLKSENSD